MQLHKEKLYLITEEAVSEAKLKKIIEQKMEVSEITPKLSEGLQYGLKMNETKTLSCQDLELRL